MPITLNPATGRYETVSVQVGLERLDELMRRCEILHERKKVIGWLGTRDHDRYRATGLEARRLLLQLEACASREPQQARRARQARTAR